MTELNSSELEQLTGGNGWDWSCGVLSGITFMGFMTPGMQLVGMLTVNKAIAVCGVALFSHW